MTPVPVFDRVSGMKKVLAGLLFLIFISGCVTGGGDADRVARSHGLDRVQVGGVDLLSCHDVVGRRFQAVDSRGQAVAGTVCCYPLRGCSVRIF